MKLDEIDLRMLQVLQSNARIPILGLAERVGVAPSACARRVRRLEDEAIIEKYAAVLNPKILNFNITAFVSVRVQHSPELAAEFSAAIRLMPNVRGCFVVSGDYDRLLWANAKDMPSLSRWVMDEVQHIPGVLHTHVNIVMEAIKDESSFFLPDLKTLKRFSLLRVGDPSVRIDEIDLRMLLALQSNARIPILDLANHAGLSPTPCSRRLRRMEDKEIIKKYIAVLNPKVMNLVTAFISVGVQHNLELAAKLRAAILKMPNVRGCYVVTADYDYLLWANAKDMQSLSRWILDEVRNIPSVLHTQTSFVMESIKDEPFFLLRDLTALGGQSAGEEGLEQETAFEGSA